MKTANPRLFRRLCCLVLVFIPHFVVSFATEVDPGSGARSSGSTPKDGKQEADSPAAPAAGKMPDETPWWEGDYALTDWGGERTSLARRGLFLEFKYTGEVRGNLDGGIATKDSGHYLGDINCSADFFTDKMKWYEDGEFFIRYENVHGKGISVNYVGDNQLLSSIDAPEYNQISELFYRQSILDDRLHFKIGKQDGTGDFIAPRYGVDFTHSAYGCIPNIPLPRFFVYAPAAVVSLDAYKWMTFAAGVYQGNFNRHALGLDKPFTQSVKEFSIAELMLTPELIKDHTTIIRAGGWHQRIDGPLIGAENSDGTPDLHTRFKHDGGGYLEFEQLLYKKPAKKKDDAKDDDKSGGDDAKPEDDPNANPEPPGAPAPLEQGLALFSQLSYSPDDRNQTPRYFGGGLYYRGLPGRDDDSIGVACASVDFSQRLRRQNKTNEAAIEAFYKVTTTPFSFFQPDFQYLLRPGGNGHNATTLGFRYQISF